MQGVAWAVPEVPAPRSLTVRPSEAFNPLFKTTTIAYVRVRATLKSADMPALSDGFSLSSGSLAGGNRKGAELRRPLLQELLKAKRLLQWGECGKQRFIGIAVCSMDSV
jgi:hypothetical protein